MHFDGRKHRQYVRKPYWTSCDYIYPVSHIPCNQIIYQLIYCTYYNKVKFIVIFSPGGAFSLRGRAADLVAARVGGRGVDRATRPASLALDRGPVPARRAREVENIESVSRGTPSHSAEPRRASETRLRILCGRVYVCSRNKTMKRVWFLFNLRLPRDFKWPTTRRGTLYII